MLMNDGNPRDVFSFLCFFSLLRLLLQFLKLLFWLTFCFHHISYSNVFKFESILKKGFSRLRLVLPCV